MSDRTTEEENKTRQEDYSVAPHTGLTPNFGAASQFGAASAPSGAVQKTMSAHDVGPAGLSLYEDEESKRSNSVRRVAEALRRQQGPGGRGAEAPPEVITVRGVEFLKVELIGKGGYGKVFLCLDPRVPSPPADNRVAIKTMEVIQYATRYKYAMIVAYAQYN